MIAILVPEPLSKQLMALQVKHRVNRWKITLKPHITLIPPGDAIVSPHQAGKLFRSWPITVARFSLTLTGIKNFRNERSSVVYSSISKTDSLILLKQQLLEFCPKIMNLQRELAFTPHITMANRLQTYEISAIEKALKRELPLFIFACQSVALFKKEPYDKCWLKVAQKSLTDTA